ncbi:MAG: SIS domain-containing protein [Clostridia bacterium]|nr:SIS domain-containing protein [Clostridia bacterium]
MNNNKLWNSVTNTLTIESQSIANLINSVSKEAVLDAIKLIGDCKGRIVIAGCGTSGAAAKKIAHSLCCIERPAAFLSPSDAVHGALGMLQKDDVFILISKGGNTREILSMIPACKTKDAKLIGVTENPDSILARESDLLLKIKVEKEPCPFNMLATASTMAVIAVFDAICIALMHYTNYTREQFGVIHPGGAVGDRLLSGEK